MNPSNPSNPYNPVILLTFDVEDWFQVENLRQSIPFSSWSNCELRIEKNVQRILDLLDSIKPNNPSNSSNSINSNNSINSQPIRATFFVLGWIAERLPNLVREIQTRGHEIASHGYGHKLCSELSAECLLEDLTRSKELLENLSGSPIYGYRAPSFSISDEVLDLIVKAGHLYDSSYNSFGLNKNYGRIIVKGSNGNGILHQITDSFYELPISNLNIANQMVPWGGGGYFRLIPSKLFGQGVLSILKRQGAYLFYMHPWEIDPDQPKVSNVPVSFKLKHYINLDKTYSKLSYFLHTFKNFRFSTCSEYLSEITQQTFPVTQRHF